MPVNDQLISFRPSKVITTQAKSKKKRSRSRSNSAGALSKSIKNYKPKHYEGTTACYTSKVNKSSSLSKGKSQSSKSTNMFQKLKNISMGGSREFFNAQLNNTTAKKK